MPTALVITTEREYASACYSAFRSRDLFPVVVGTIDQALCVLTQYRVDVLVVHASGRPFVDASGRPDNAAWYDHLRGRAPDTPIVVLADLPPPEALAGRLREAVARSVTKRAGPTADGSPASSSSRGESSV